VQVVAVVHGQYFVAPRLWSRGDRLSSQYQGSDHVVSDWKAKHLRQPPRGGDFGGGLAGYSWIRRKRTFAAACRNGGVSPTADIGLTQMSL
jgi:Ni/Co efflux regulator RcnB